MQREIEILCPNCTEPIILTPDKSILEIISCCRCETKQTAAEVKKALEPKETD